ncbi:single-stranded DNA-binding protein [Bacillus tequilensis]|nr:single-stranded DNA-binding protein [Bacillus tequilensis]
MYGQSTQVRELAIQARPAARAGDREYPTHPGTQPPRMVVLRPLATARESTLLRAQHRPQRAGHPSYRRGDPQVVRRTFHDHPTRNRIDHPNPQPRETYGVVGASRLRRRNDRPARNWAGKNRSSSMSQISIRGNITAPVELRYTSSGKAVGNVTVAVNRGKDDNKQTDFYRVTLWESLAENAAQLEKGTSVLLIGRMESRDFEDKQGNKRTSWEVTADAFGPDLRFQTANVSKSGAGRSQGATGAPNASTADAWATPAGSDAQNASWPTAGSFGDDTPF